MMFTLDEFDELEENQVNDKKQEELSEKTNEPAIVPPSPGRKLDKHSYITALKQIQVSLTTIPISCISVSKISSLVKNHYFTHGLPDFIRPVFYSNSLETMPNCIKSKDLDLDVKIEPNLLDSLQKIQTSLLDGYVNYYRVKSTHHKEYIFLILSKLLHIYNVDHITSRDQYISIFTCLRNLIVSFSPSLLYSTLITCMEWRGLIQYHMPILYRRILMNFPTDYHFAPLVSIFSGCCREDEIISAIWDRFILHQNTTLPYFFSLSLLIFYKDRILSENEKFQNVKDRNEHIFDNLAIESIEHVNLLFDTAFQLIKDTPDSILQHVKASEKLEERGKENLLVPATKKEKSNKLTFFPGTFCMYLSIGELCSQLYQSSPSLDAAPPISFFIIDSRPTNQFNASSIPSSVSLPADLVHTDAEKFYRVFDEILNRIEKSHVVIVGDKEEEISSILTFLIGKNQAKISVLEGGYYEFHQTAMHYNFSLTNHSHSNCTICQPALSLSSVKSFFSSTKQKTSSFINSSLPKLLESMSDVDPRPHSNIIENPNLKQWIFDANNPLISCFQIINSQPVPGRVLITKKALIWLEKCSVSDDDRTNVEFGYSYAYHLQFIRRITFKKPLKQILLTIKSPSHPEVELLEFIFDQPEIFIQIVQGNINEIIVQLNNKPPTQ